MKQHEMFCCLIFSLEIVVTDEVQYFSKLAESSLQTPQSISCLLARFLDDELNII